MVLEELVTPKEVLSSTVGVALMEVLKSVSKVLMKLEKPTYFVVGKEQVCLEKMKCQHR